MHGSVAYPARGAPAPPRCRAARPRRRRPRRQRRRASSTPTSGPTPPAATSSRSPSSRSPATRPRTCCCARRSSRSAPSALEKFAARTGRAAAVDRLPRGAAATSPTRPRCARTDASQGVYRKHLLPNYAVFDEQRYFAPSTVDGPLFVVGGVRVARHRSARTRGARPARSSRRPPAAPSSSSTSTRRRTTRAGSTSARRCSRTRAADASVPVALREPRRRPGRARLRRRVDAVRRERSPRRARARSSTRTCSSSTSTCGPRSAAACSTRAAGSRAARCPRSRSARRASASTTRRRASSRCSPPVHEVYEALVLGTRDYVPKNGFTDVLIGLSGGIDSSLVAAIAADALGPEHVIGVLMPSRYSSEGSVTDAERARRQPRHPHADRPDRAGAHARSSTCSRRAVRRAPSPGSPRRTSRPASAARSS